MERRAPYVVDTWGMSREAEVDACRVALRLLTGRAHEFDTDIPLSREPEWPPEVRSAAHRLLTHSKHRREQNDGYRQTGSLSAQDQSDWDAFVTFAPYAYDASVWGADDTALAELADEGTSLVVRLEPDERIDLANTVGQERVIPLSHWSKISNRVLKERRRGL